MATSVNVLCGLCEGQNITKHADHWCPECEEGLCSDCLIYHKISKASKHHEVISVENFRKLPKNISSIVHHCPEHDKRYQNYCPHHESFCCPMCIAANHKACNGLLAIDDVIKTAKSSSLLDSIEEKITYLKRNFNKFLAERDENLVQNQSYKRNVLENIKSVREQINAHFDKLEQQFLRDISIAEKQIKDRIDNFSKELREKLRVVEDLEKDVVAIKEYASDLQSCLGSMKLKNKVEEEEKYINSLEEENLKQIFLKCSFDEKVLADILSRTRLGSVSIEEITSAIDLKASINTRALIMIGPLPSKQKSIYDINISLKCKFEVPGRGIDCCITGCDIRPDGKIILVDRKGSKLLMFKERGYLERKKNYQTIIPLTSHRLTRKQFVFRIVTVND